MINYVKLSRKDKIVLFKNDIRIKELYATYKVRPLNALEKIIFTQIKREYGL